MSELVVLGTSTAEANFGRWVARCGRPDRCDSAAHLERLQPGFICAECGAATEVVWPPADMVEGIERLLTLRPNPKNRNWEPGETLPDLLLQNVTHGVLDSVDFTQGSIAVTDERIERDLLPVLDQHGGPSRELTRSC